MGKTLLISLLLTIAACASLPAQTFSLITGREPVTSLDGLWRFHTGDNPAWASPSFDDSKWPLLRSDESWTKQGYANYEGYAWYRFRIQVPDGSEPLALFLPRIRTGYQVFANGKFIGGEGSIVPTRNEVTAYFPAAYRLPQVGTGPQFMQIAIRVWYGAALGLPGGMLQPGSAAGAPAVLAPELTRDRDARTVDAVSDYGYCLLALFVGLTTLVLFFSRLADREYLWFSVLLLASGAEVAMGIVGDYVPIPGTFYYAISGAAGGISVIAALLFFSTVLRTPRSFFWWLAFAGRFVSPIGLLFYYLGWMTWGEGHAVGIALMLPADLWFVGTLAIPAVRKGVSARWLLAPAVLYYSFRLLGHLSVASFQLGWQKTRMTVDFPLISRPFPLTLYGIFGYVFVLSLLLFLVRRFSAARQEEARLSQEMEAARSVQSLLIPAAPPATPGFAVEHIYLPASEVGGDFFQVLPGDDGSLLIVVGDVSGKGLQAAMTVSAIVGALRDGHERRPAQVLAHLNRILSGQIGGFVTCSATLIADDGAMIVANAGHLPPYRNGEELAVPSGLPLGMLADASYEEQSYELAPTDRLTFISDGVVEARNAKGELLGFDRMAALTRKPAAEIAEAPQRWGQQDDITVLTLALATKTTPVVSGAEPVEV
ncbi:MAG TPA: SpoIIE family protein phosphatase [Terracidiphilus sp.]|nr:SpoIIE family protein phosphatase [Terracidiphilus sp.]